MTLVKMSFIVPCYNEEKVLNKMYEVLTNTAKKLESDRGYEYEIVFINDGSKDQTLIILNDLASKDAKVKYLSFSRNFGKESAIFAGIQNVTGDLCAILDADLQHPPEMLLQMIGKYEQGYDQVIAKRTRVGEARFRTVLSKIYYKVVNKLIEVNLEDGIGDYRILSRKAIDALVSLQENNRFSKGLFSWIGFKTAVIEYGNQVREDGESKWGIKSLFNYAIDGILSFNTKPLRAVIYTGIVITLTSFVYIIFSLIKIISFGIESPGYFTIISSILLLGGIQLISVGIVGEYVGKIFYEVKQRPIYLVDETNMSGKESVIPEDKELFISSGTKNE